MHHCQRFREDLTDLVFDGTPPNSYGGAYCAELQSCESCATFFQDARGVVRLMESGGRSVPELPDSYWSGFEYRLRQRLNNTGNRPVRWRGYRWLSLASAAVAIVIVTLILFRTGRSLENTPSAPIAAVAVQTAVQTAVRTAVQTDSQRELDSKTADFLERSELFLRTFVKIEPTDTEDLEDALMRARFQLHALQQRKDSDVAFTPVQAVLEDYETVLREINNVEETSMTDISEIQQRIERRGLIASLKVYQPRPAALEQ